MVKLLMKFRWCRLLRFKWVMREYRDQAWYRRANDDWSGLDRLVARTASKARHPAGKGRVNP